MSDTVYYIIVKPDMRISEACARTTPVDDFRNQLVYANDEKLVFVSAAQFAILTAAGMNINKVQEELRELLITIRDSSNVGTPKI
jgi:hypothetical protein